jgi:AI-2 transport protein TqsA
LSLGEFTWNMCRSGLFRQWSRRQQRTGDGRFSIEFAWSALARFIYEAWRKGRLMNSDASPDRPKGARLWLLLAITVILTGWALYATAAFMVPVVFSLFLALLVSPLGRMMAGVVPEKISWLGHVAATSAILVVLLTFVGVMSLAAQQLAERFPESDDLLLLELGIESPQDSRDPADSDNAAGGAADSQTPSAQGIFGSFVNVVSGAGGSLVGLLWDGASAIAMRILSAAGATLGAIVLVFFLTLIMLIEAPVWGRKIDTILNSSARFVTTDSIGIIAARLCRYLLVRTILGVVKAARYVAWLWVFGIDLLVVWALAAFVLNFIPTFGSLIAGALPVVCAAVQNDYGTAIVIGLGILAIEQAMGNFVDPRVQGRQVSLSSLVVLIALVWGWIWGIAVTILAVPITISAMIICAHVGPLRPVVLLLSNASDLDDLDRQAAVAGKSQQQ